VRLGYRQTGAGKPEAMKSRGPEQRRTTMNDSMKAFGALGSVGFSFVLAIVVGVGVGLLIDRWIGRGHWGFFIFFFLGLVGGVVNVYRASKSIK
jgi:F0F1-type ATP synthase assembly protein I